MTTGGIVICTFTPLKGLSAVALAFLPHLAPAPAEQGARSGGVEGMAPLSRGRSKIAHEIPPQQRTAGLVYSVPEADFVVEPFELSDWWPRAYAMAVGRNRTAVLWGARDPEQDVIYLYSEHSLGRTEPSIHADAIVGSNRSDIFGLKPEGRHPAHRGVWEARSQPRGHRPRGRSRHSGDLSAPLQRTAQGLQDPERLAFGVPPP